jgi:hypothetical protein
MVHTAPMWPTAIPRTVRHEAFALAHDVLGSETMERFRPADQEAVLAHVIGVTGMIIYIAREAGFSERAAERIGRKAAGHDVGKLAIAGISDKGAWDKKRRLWVRREHCAQGGLWVVENADRLHDAPALQFAIENHHTEVPDPELYRNMDGALPEWWGDVHLLQACDRLHAITSRPYVREREGNFTAQEAIEIALGADPRSDSPALPPDVLVDGQNLDLFVGLGEMAEVLTPKP